jgi:hypothetical protein
LIGTEFYDPDWWTTFPTGDDCRWIGDPVPREPVFCRYSDALVAHYASNAPFALGRIARPAIRTRFQREEYPDSAGGLVINGSSPTFRVVAERPYPFQGQILNKVGRTTGWTYGRVTATCVNSLAIGTAAHARLCQTDVNAGVAGGDSGSPVFAFPGNGRTVGGNIILQGILWGGSVGNAPEDVEFAFSPMFGIEREVGLLQTH